MIATSLATSFVRTSRAHLIGEYVPKIDRCLAELGDEGVWWRPNARSNSVGNLVLHVCGNARQWILSGVLEREDDRNREAEFSAEGGLDADGLRNHLAQRMAEVGEGLAELEERVGSEPGLLQRKRVIQGMSVSVLEAVYHVVEHASQHTGQIIWVAKARGDHDLGFWVVEGGVARPNW